MSVDLEAIAQRGRCEVSSLRLALPLLEQGYTPPFLARYRRDELGGIDETSLWSLCAAVQNERTIASRREELQQVWQATTFQDPAIGHAISKANSQRMLSRLARRLKTEAGETSSEGTRLAVRVLNPRKGDGSDFAEIAAKVEGIENVDAAVSGLDDALVQRLAGDPRIIGAAVRWLAKNARIHIASISDPHTGEPDRSGNDSSGKKDEANPADDASPSESKKRSDSKKSVDPQVESAQAEPEKSTKEESNQPGDASSGDVENQSSDEVQAGSTVATLTTQAEQTPTAETEAISQNPEPATAAQTETPTTEDARPELPETVTSETVAPDVTTAAKKAVVETAEAVPAKSPKAKTKKPAKQQKKVSPRQRRRRWLVGVLKPLSGKKFQADKLSSFQIVMLGRALRSQVAQCSFEYDAGKLVAELQRTAGTFNRNFDEQLQEIVLQNESSIREAAEAAWWDDLQERASGKLVSIAAEHLQKQINRGAVEAKVVMSIDAVGPRTAATTIVASDGRLLHSEDLPCLLSAAQRSQTVTRMGELIHTYHVDLVVISNGPSRRATMIALGDLIGQSPEKSIRWTLADRSGADAYAGSNVSDQEMRSTPRRFRSAAWLAFSVLQPAQALAKVDPLKLRLSSFQRELADEALADTLEDVMISGASRGGVDVNSAPVSWLSRLPGMSQAVAQAIDEVRRKQLFTSREQLSQLEGWGSEVESRQSLPFLRVFGSEETLDGTLIHPADYPLAKRLAASLEIELPPATPPGYSAPDFLPESESKPKSIEPENKPTPIPVEDFTESGNRVSEFNIEGSDSATLDSANPQEVSTQAVTASVEQASVEQAAEQPAQDTGQSQRAVEQPESELTETESSEEQDAPEASTEEVATTVEAATDAESADAIESTDQPDSGKQATEAASDAVSVEIAEAVKHPLPERSKIDKCVKEWQVGTRRTRQIVHWLCDPFGDSDASGSPPAVMSTMPSSKALKQGDQVIGVVVGVMPFGVFVELAPDCSGLIHVSRISDSYVEDLHEAIQVGDVVTAWVTGIDEKRRRVGLSAISPEREAELEEAKRTRGAQSGHRGGQHRGGQHRGGQHRGGQHRGGQHRGGQHRGGQGERGGQGRQGRADGQRGGSKSGDSHGGSKPAGSKTSAGDRSRSGGPPGGGRGRQDNRGGRSRDRHGSSREKQSYRVVAKAEAKPLTEDMKEGKEPLRSFGDLMQFLGKEKEGGKESKPSKPKPEVAQKSVEPNTPEASPTPETGSETATPKPAQPDVAQPDETSPATDSVSQADVSNP